MILTSDQEGMMHNCSLCRSACESTDYATSMSYAALSSLSVQQLLSNNVTALQTKYKEALDITQRVQTVNMQDTVSLLQNISFSLGVYRNTITCRHTFCILHERLSTVIMDGVDFLAYCFLLDIPKTPAE